MTILDFLLYTLRLTITKYPDFLRSFRLFVFMLGFYFVRIQAKKIYPLLFDTNLSFDIFDTSAIFEFIYDILWEWRLSIIGNETGID